MTQIGNQPYPYTHGSDDTVPVGANSATGAAVPANTHYVGLRGPASNLAGMQSASIANGQFDTGLLGAGMLINGTSDFKYYSVGGNNAADAMATGISAFTWSQNAVYNNATWDRSRSIINATDSTGTGIQAVGLVAQLDDTSPTAITENQFGNVRMTKDRSLMVNQVFSYTHISTATTTTIKASAGFIHAISVNTKGTVASTITVYDNTAGSGTVVGVIDSLNLSGAFVLDVSLLTGITIVTTGTVAPDLTVSWR